MCLIYVLAVFRIVTLCNSEIVWRFGGAYCWTCNLLVSDSCLDGSSALNMGLYLPPKRRVLYKLQGVTTHKTVRFITKILYTGPYDSNSVNTFQNMVCIFYRKFAFDKKLNSNVSLILLRFCINYWRYVPTKEIWWLSLQCHLSGVPWLVITGSGLNYWNYWHLLQSLLITINFSATANLPTLQITRTRCPFPGNGFITGTITSNHYEVFLPFLVQSPWTAEIPEFDPIFQF
jgi:hypothetical protein